MKAPLHIFSVVTIPLVGVGAFSPDISQRRSSSASSSSSSAPNNHSPATIIPTNTALSYANDPADPMALPFNPLLDTDLPFEAAPTQSKRDKNWRNRYSQLLSYHQRFGNANVPLNWPENKSLATWVINQRRKYRNKSLKPHQMNLLKAIDFTWDRQKSWTERFVELEQYRQTHGTCTVRSSDEENKELYVWCCNQRQQYRQLMESGSSSLTSERVKLLESIGFLEESSVQQSTWNKRMQELRDYKKQHGHTNVPRHCSANPKLGRWVDTQRTSYRLQKLRKPSPLTQERIDVLNEIGFEWSPSEKMSKGSEIGGNKTPKTKYTPWNTRYNELQRFEAKYGHVLVDHKTRLGEWVRAQRRQYNLMLKGAKSSLTSTRLVLLKELGVFEYQPALEAVGAQGQLPSSFVPAAPFIRVGMTDDELIEAWHDRFAALRD